MSLPILIIVILYTNLQILIYYTVQFAHKTLLKIGFLISFKNNKCLFYVTKIHILCLQNRVFPLCELHLSLSFSNQCHSDMKKAPSLSVYRYGRWRIVSYCVICCRRLLILRLYMICSIRMLPEPASISLTAISMCWNAPSLFLKRCLLTECSIAMASIF